MSESKRAARRHHVERLKAKAKKIASHKGLPAEFYVLNYNNLCVCSCYGCGNPRKWGYKSFSEEYTINYLSKYYLEY